MRRLLVSVCVMAFVLGASSVYADKEATVKPMEFLEATPIIVGPAGPAQDCQVGNLNTAAWAIGGWLLPPEEYKLVFDPRAGCTVCQIGFQVETVHLYVQTAGASTLLMSVNVEEASYPNAPDCPEPGPVLCTSELFTVNIPQAGLWNIGLPIACECYTMDRIYLLSVYFESVSGNLPDLVTDNYPTLCTTWNNWGSGWIDLVGAYGWPGNILMWADAYCCTPPVPVEQKTWGAIKELYED